MKRIKANTIIIATFVLYLNSSYTLTHVILLSLSFANITLCIDICKKVNEKAANDCSLAAV